MSSRYDAILFDFDGVLADSEPVHWACWRDVLAARGIDFPWTYYRERAIGVHDSAMDGVIRPFAPDGIEWFARALEEKREMFRDRSRAGMIAGEVCELLAALPMPLAVVTSSARREVEPILLAAGIVDRFAALVYGESVERGKPDPEPYRTAAGLLGARRPLAVEDSDPGERSARAAGFDCLRLPRPSDLPRMLREKLAP